MGDFFKEATNQQQDNNFIFSPPAFSFLMHCLRPEASGNMLEYILMVQRQGRVVGQQQVACIHNGASSPPPLLHRCWLDGAPVSI